MTSFVSFVCHELRNPLQGVTSGAVRPLYVMFRSLANHSNQEFLTETLEKLDSLANTLSSTSRPVNGERAQIVPGARRLSTGHVEEPTLVAMQGLITYAKELVVSLACFASFVKPINGSPVQHSYVCISSSPHYQQCTRSLTVCLKT